MWWLTKIIMVGCTTLSFYLVFAEPVACKTTCYHSNKYNIAKRLNVTLMCLAALSSVISVL